MSVSVLEEVRERVGEPPATIKAIIELAERQGRRVRVEYPRRARRDPLLYVDGKLVAAWLPL